MRYLYLFSFFILCTISNSIHGHPINADLALRRITIDSNFNGVDMLIFGATDIKGDLIILVHGPKRTIILNKKERKYGLWFNAKREKIEDVKQFYAVTSTKELSEITDEQTLKSITINDLNFSDDLGFNSALKNIKLNTKLYSESIKNIDLINEKLFRTNIKFPNNIPQGRYIVEVLLFHNHLLFGFQTIPLMVSNVGIESFVFDMHQFHPFVYAICSVIGALMIGWISSLVKRR